jgi:hypothetical protein
MTPAEQLIEVNKGLSVNDMYVNICAQGWGNNLQILSFMADIIELAAIQRVNELEEKEILDRLSIALSRRIALLAAKN